MQMKTGCSALNQVLEGVQLKAGQMSAIVVNPWAAFRGPQVIEKQFMEMGRRLLPVSNENRELGILAICTDSVTGREVVIAKKKVALPSLGSNGEFEVYAVHELHGKPENGLFFITRTLAECYFTSITGDPEQQDVETGGRTLKELSEYLQR